MKQYNDIIEDQVKKGIIEKIDDNTVQGEIKHYPAGTQRHRDVPWRSLKGRNVRDLQGTFSGLLENQHKNWWLNQKKCFLDATVLVLHIYYCFLLRKQMFKSSKWRRPRDLYGTQLLEIPGTKW